MTSRWWRGADHERSRGATLDPIAEGQRHHLSASVSLAIWERVRNEASERNTDGLKRRFHQVAARAAAHHGQLGPTPGRTTLVEAEALLPYHHGVNDQLVPAPGRTTLLEAEARQPYHGVDVFSEPPQGKRTRVAVETPPADPPHRGEVGALLASLSSEAVERPTPARMSRWFAIEPTGDAIHPATLAAQSATSARGPMLLRRETEAEAEADPTHPAVAEALATAGGGEPLPDALRAEMEVRLGADFRHVRIHTGPVAAAAARALRARAFTLGEHIFFAAGAFSPSDVTGGRLLVHELTHVVQAQQRRISASGSGGLEVSHPTDALEREAEAASVAGPSTARAQDRPAEQLAERARARPLERATNGPAAAARAGVLHLSPDPTQSADPFDEFAFAGYAWNAILWQYTVPTLAEARAAVVNTGLVSASDLAASTVKHVVRASPRYTYWSYRHPSKGVVARITIPSKPMGFQQEGSREVALYSANLFVAPTAWEAAQAKLAGGATTGATGAMGNPNNKTGSDRDASGRLLGGADRDAKLKQLPTAEQAAITAETNRLFWERTGHKKGQQLGTSPEDKQMAKSWMDIRDELVIDRERIAALPEDVKAILLSGHGKVLDAKDYKAVLAVADKLAGLSNEDRAAFKLLPKKAADDVARFSRAVDLFIARKAELKAALDAELKKSAAAQPPTLQGTEGKKREGTDDSKIATMSETDRYELARQKTSELTEAQLTHMAQHPGETLGDFAKSATLMNTGDTFHAIGKDLAEAASGDANSWARWAAGTGAGAKMSGWLLAVAGILYAASWLTGVGELATIAAAAIVLLGTTLTLSLAESELRIKAASQATNPEEFKRNVELAAAARANVVVGVALIVVAAVLHFTAKALFPKTLEAVKTSLKNFRERVRLKGSIYELKPQIASELGLRKGELAKAAQLSKQKAQASAAELERMTTAQFVDKTEAGGDGFLDQSKLPAEQRVNFRELLKTPEGRKAIEGYKQRLVKALNVDVPAQIDQLAQEYASKIDDFLKDVDAAKNHDDLKVAIDKLDDVLTDEHAKTFMDGQQQEVTKQKLEEAAGEAHDEMLATLKEAVVKRVRARIAAAGADFALTYSDAELDAIVKRGKALSLPDKMIEDLIYVGSRVKKAIAAADLMDQMKNWETEVKPRGYPYRFDDLAQFKQFSRELLERVQRAGLPIDDVRMQGSSLRKPAANDVDVAVFVEEAVFDKLLIDRYDLRVTKGGTKVSLAGKSHAELVQLAADIEANPASYNAQGSTFQNAIKSGIINSKSDIVKPLKQVRAEIAAKYPTLNIETISVLIRDGLFDLLPDLPVKAN